jgi:hypothetical protein
MQCNMSMLAGCIQDILITHGLETIENRTNVLTHSWNILYKQARNEVINSFVFLKPCRNMKTCYT